MSDTYSLSTSLGKVRLLIGDTDVGGTHVFSDAEITAFLDMRGGNIYQAAAQAIGSIISSKAYLAKIISREGYRSEEFAISELLALKKQFEDDALSNDGLQVGEFNLNDEHFESYRPGWRDTDTLVVE